MPSPTAAGGPVQALAALRTRPPADEPDDEPDISELFEQEGGVHPVVRGRLPSSQAWEELAGDEAGVVLRRSDGTLWAARPLDVSEVLKVAFPPTP
jgi:hypothetical protein